jgi:hypothetical protein
MTPHNAPSGSVWEYTFISHESRQFIILDGYIEPRCRIVLWLYDQPIVGSVLIGSRINSNSVRLA